MQRKKVLIVEDSPTVRTLLEHIIGNDPRLEIVASVTSAEEAMRVLPHVKPDVISLDIRLPGMNGLEATRRIMAEHPTPIVVVSANVDADDFNISMNALSAGAVTVVEKPVATTMNEYVALAERLCRQLAIMSEVHVIRQRAARGQPYGPATRPQLAAAALSEPIGDFRVLGVVASTGGPSALVKLLTALGSDYSLPIVLVQHITPSFMGGFVTWLNDTVPPKVVLAEGGQIAMPGVVYVAPADRHLEMQGGRFKLVQGPPVSSQKPSGTVLLQSLARSYGRHALGVVLTGMGDDGASGLGEMRRAGGHTIAEDESTAVVYGMPAVAARLGAACEQLPLHEIGPRLLQLSRSPRATP